MFTRLLNAASAVSSYSPNLQLPQYSVSLPKPLLYPPDMSLEHTTKDWLDAGATKFVYPTDANGNNAILYLGYLLCDCDRDVPISIELYEKRDWLNNRKPLCGDTDQTRNRLQLSDDKYLEKTDFGLDVFLSGQDCTPWHDGEGVEACVYEGGNTVWLRGSGPGYTGGGCLLNFNGIKYGAFLKVSDADENPDKNTPNLGFKKKWNLLNPPVPNGLKSGADLAHLYDPDTKTLTLRQEFILGHNSRGKCEKTFGFSLLPKAADSTTLDQSPWLFDYLAYQNLVLPQYALPSDPVPVPEMPPQNVPAYIIVPLALTLGAKRLLDWRAARIKKIQQLRSRE